MLDRYAVRFLLGLARYAKGAGGKDLELFAVSLLGQAAQVLVEGAEVVAVRHGVQRVVAEARHLRVILEGGVVEDIEDTQLELGLLEERQGLLGGQPVSYVLLRSAQQLKDGLPRSCS